MRFRPPKHSNKNYKMRLIIFLGFLFGFSTSLTAFVSSSYYKEVVGSDQVAIFFALSSCVVIAGLFSLHKIMHTWGRSRVLICSLMIQAIAAFMLSVVPVGWLGAVLLTAYFSLYGVIWAMWDIVLEVYSDNESTGHVRGAFLSVWSIGSFIGPIVSTFLVGEYGFYAVFFVLMILYVLMFISALLGLSHIPVPHQQQKQLNFFQQVGLLTQDSNIKKIYIAELGLRFFYAIMVIYMPLHLLDLGFSWVSIGVMFTAMFVPFILLEYPSGVLADKKYGEKEILIVGYCILIVATFLFAFVTHVSVLLWGALLVFSRIGAALAESMQETYFYKKVDSDDVVLMELFRTSRPLAYIVAAGLSVIAQIVTDIPGIFAMLGICLIGFLWPIITLVDTEPNAS